jgi:Ca-activated chloride channel family protein
MKSVLFWQTPLLLVLVYFLSGCGQTVQAQERQPTVRVQVDRVNVGVIVTDGTGKFVEGLHREDFHVFDNGVEQPLTDFAAIEEPAQALLLIEAGPAVYLLESGHVLAAYALLRGLSRDDRVAVVKYAEAPEALLDFTPDKQAAEAALEQLRFNLGFGQLNLTSSVSKVLEWLTHVQGKKTIILLSTGVDTSPSNQPAMALQQLKTGDVRLFAVSLAGGLQTARPTSKKKTPAKNSTQTVQQFEEANQLLGQMAEATGGRAYFPASAKAFDEAYAEIAQLIRHEYSLAFAPPIRDGLVHAIEVRTDALKIPTANTRAPSYRLDHRRAYLAPAAAKQ